MVSPFENPFPTRGRRWFLHIPSTGRDAPTASCSVMRYYCLPNYFLRAGQGSFYQDGSDSSMEIPRLVPLARDDSYIESLGFLGKGRDRVRRWDSLVERALRCSQKIIRRQSDGKTEQLAVGAAQPVDGMRKHPPPAPSPHGVQGPGPLVGKGFSKGETTIGFAL